MASFPGHFWDGRTAARREVSVVVTSQGLRLLDPSGEELAAWPYDQARFTRRPDGTRPARLCCAIQPDARLVVTDPEFLGALRAAAPHLERRSERRFKPRNVAFWAGGVGALLVLVTVLLPSLTGLVVHLIRQDWEVAVGDQIVQYAMGSSRRCVAAPGEAALARLVDRLGGALDTDYVFDVRVYDSPIANAMAAPGGHIVIFRGLIAAADSGDEVAGVIAHEMGHVVERHATRAVVRELGLAALLGLVGGTGGSQLGIDPGALSRSFLSNTYSQRAEQQADDIALGILNRLDIRGEGLAGFFERAAAEHGAGGGLRSTHPSSPLRASAVRQAATGTRPAMSAEDWRDLRGICGVGAG